MFSSGYRDASSIPAAPGANSLRARERTISSTWSCSSVNANRTVSSVLDERRRDDEPLDLRGALVDLRDLGVAEMALRGVLLDVAVPAVDLDPLDAGPHRRLGRIQLRHRRLLRMPDLPVL